MESYSIKEIYNIPEIMEVEIPFPYNIMIRNKKIRLLSEIKLEKKDEYWVIQTPTNTIYDIDVNGVINKWNKHVRNILYEKLYKNVENKLFFLVLVLCNFAIIFTLSIITNIAADTVLICLFLLNLFTINLTKDMFINYFADKDIKSYMDDIINKNIYYYSYYNCKPLSGLAKPIHLKNETENNSELKSFIDVLNEKIKNIKNNKIQKSLEEIKEFINDIDDYKKDNIIAKNEINAVKKSNKDILDILDILDNNPNKKIIVEIENILDDYINIYSYHKESLKNSCNFNNEIKLEVIKSDVKAQNDYIKIMKK